MEEASPVAENGEDEGVQTQDLLDVGEDEGVRTQDLLDIGDEEGSMSRKRAALYVLPFFSLGVANLILLLFWGLHPLWAFMIFPPILFTCVLTWIAFRTGFVGDRDE